MTTRAEFRTQLRSLLIDATQFPDSLVDGWIQEAIRDYSHHLPRLASATIVMVAAQKSYSLSSYDVISLRLVEYPTGETPRRLLTFLPRSESIFDGGQYYDVKSDWSTLYLAESPAAGEAAYIEYDTLHAIPATDGTTLTVPDQHLELLRLFIKWRALQQLEMDETVSLERTPGMVNSLGLNAFRAAREYRFRLRDVLKTVAVSDRSGPWQMDKWDRTY